MIFEGELDGGPGRDGVVYFDEAPGHQGDLDLAERFAGERSPV